MLLLADIIHYCELQDLFYVLVKGKFAVSQRTDTIKRLQAKSSDTSLEC
jgi:hypothetical protein